MLSVSFSAGPCLQHILAWVLTDQGGAVQLHLNQGPDSASGDGCCMSFSRAHLQAGDGKC